MIEQNTMDKSIHHIIYKGVQEGGLLADSGFLNIDDILKLESAGVRITAQDLIHYSKFELTESPRLEDVPLSASDLKSAKEFISKAYAEFKDWMTGKLFLPTSDRTKDEHKQDIVNYIQSKLKVAVKARYEVMVTKMLKLFLKQYPENERLQVIKAQDSFFRTALHQVAKLGSMELVKFILEQYPENERLQVIKAQDTVLHQAAKSGSMELFKFILEQYPENERLQAMQYKDELGDTVLHYAIHYNKEEDIETMLNLISEDERVELIKVRNNQSQTALYSAAIHYIEFNKINCVLKLIPENKRWEIINSDRLLSRNIKSNLSRIIFCNEQKGFIDFLSLIPPYARLQIMQDQDGLGDTVLHSVILYKKAEGVKTVLELISEDDRVKLIKTTNNQGETALVYAAKFPNGFDKIICMLKLIPENERWEIIDKKDKKGLSLLTRAIKYKEYNVVFGVLQLIPEDKFFGFLNQHFNDLRVFNEDEKLFLHFCGGFEKNQKLFLNFYRKAIEPGAVALFSSKNCPGERETVINQMVKNSKLIREWVMKRSKYISSDGTQLEKRYYVDLYQNVINYFRTIDDLEEMNNLYQYIYTPEILSKLNVYTHPRDTSIFSVGYSSLFIQMMGLIRDDAFTKLEQQLQSQADKITWLQKMKDLDLFKKHRCKYTLSQKTRSVRKIEAMIKADNRDPKDCLQVAGEQQDLKLPLSCPSC